MPLEKKPNSCGVIRSTRRNYSVFRISKERMESIRNHTTLWRATCGFQKYKVDYRDYIRGNNSDFDIISHAAAGACKKIEFVNIRGHFASQKTVAFWQYADVALHTDSSAKLCEFDATPGSTTSEDNFGYYGYINSAFRCTENQNGTTQIWFGDYV